MQTVLSLVTLEEMRTRLECERSRLREQIAELRTAEGLDQARNSVELRGEVTDQAEQGMDQAEWDRLRIEELGLSDHLTEVEHALAKFNSGTYGVCEKCGAPIPEGRLQALPEARFDIEHETALEQSIQAEEQLPERGL